MASWRLSGSIWEAHSSILEPPNLDFSEIFAYVWNVYPRNPSKNPENAKNARNAKNAINAKDANHFRRATTMRSITKAYSISMAGAKKGGRRWSPPGGYNKKQFFIFIRRSSSIDSIDSINFSAEFFSAEIFSSGTCSAEKFSTKNKFGTKF